MRGLVLLLGVGLVVEAYADAPTAAEQARIFKDLGVRAMERSEFEMALRLFERANRLVPSPRMKFNIANVLLKLKRNAEAVDLLDQFLTEAPDAPQPQLTFALEQVQKLESGLARLNLTGDVGLLVLVGQRQLQVPARVRFDPGEFNVSVDKAGYQPFGQTVVLRPGEERALEIRLTPEVAPPPPPPAVVVVEPPPPVVPAVVAHPAVPVSKDRPVYRKWWLWTTVGAGAAALAVGLGVGLTRPAKFDKTEPDLFASGGQ